LSPKCGVLIFLIYNDLFIFILFYSDLFTFITSTTPGDSKSSWS